MCKKKVVKVWIGFCVMLGVILGIYFVWWKQQTDDITLKQIQEVNGGVMPEYSLKENGTISWLNGNFSQRKMTSVEDALIALNDIKTLLGIKDAQTELKNTYVEEDALGMVCQFEQVYKGISVYGSMVSLWADFEGNGGFLRADCSIIPDDFICDPTISMKQAQKYAMKEFVHASLEETEQEEEYLCIYETEKNVRLAWRVLLSVEAEGYEVIVDAQSGEVLYVGKTSCHVAEQKLQVTAMGLQGKLHTINITKNTKGIYELQDKTRKIILYNGGGTTSNFTMFTSKSETTWDMAAVSAMANLQAVYDYYLNVTGRYSYDGAYFLTTASVVKAAVNTGIVNNAYWNGNKKMILIGVGSEQGGFYPISFAVAKDIIAHEFTHAVIADRTSLEHVYYGPAGAINEAYSDIFGCLIEGDWKIGEDLTKKKSLRDMVIPFNTNNPSVVGGAFYQDYKTDTTDYGGIHKNSTIISHIAYVLYESGMSRNQLAQLWYRSLCLGYGKDTDFYDVRVNVLAAAKALGLSEGQIAAIHEAFDDANITQKTCQENSSSYKSLYEKLAITNENQSIGEGSLQKPVKEYVLQWKQKTLDLDLSIEGVTKDGTSVTISYENQEYRNEKGEVVMNLVCDAIKGAATEQIQVWSEEIDITECNVFVYGDTMITNQDCEMSEITVTVYENGKEKEWYLMPQKSWNQWCVFKKEYKKE